MKYLEKNIDLGLLIIRLAVGGLMLFHGISKMIYGVGFIEQVVSGAGLPHFVTYGVYIGEVVAPIFIIGGLATRAAAGIFAFNCLVATLLVHTSMIFTLGAEGGWALELIGLYFFGAVALIFTGGGRYAISNKHIWD
ncbi:DoxX family protein [uncultured Bacteroides sp.]|uniref:DoxX family protein n=1 Tax=uncultured Bacteroides sp. TaxID=162156 RepID=UPI002AA77A03|nr:DoxX family protein [uncultured Bacteroides sp.]